MSDFSFVDRYDAGYDLPDSRDILVEEVLDMAGAIPEEKRIHKTPILNQGQIGACTLFGTSGTLFEDMYRDAEAAGVPYNQPYDLWKMWEKAKARGASDTRGWSIQGVLQLLVDNGFIAGYARLSMSGGANFDRITQAIAKGECLVTGSAYGAWRRIAETHVYEDGSTPAGHIFSLAGYTLKTENKIHVRNSWSEDWGDGGFFYLPQDKVGSLYSVYMLLGPSYADALKNIKNVRAKSYADAALARKVWNGERPDDIATDDEIYLMAQRGLDILGGRERQWWAVTFDERILRGKSMLPVWNGRDATKIASPGEVATMFTRAVKRDSTLGSKILTRFQVAAAVGRDFLPV